MKLNEHTTFSCMDFHSTTAAEHLIHYMQQSRTDCILKKTKQCHVVVSIMCLGPSHGVQYIFRKVERCKERHWSPRTEAL